MTDIDLRAQGTRESAQPRQPLVGSTLYPLSVAPRLLRGWRNQQAGGPACLTSSFRMLRLPEHRALPPGLRGGRAVCVQAIAADRRAADRLDAHLRFLARPLFGGWAPAPEVQTVPVCGRSASTVAVGDGLTLTRLEGWAIEVFLRAAAQQPAFVLAELRNDGGRTANVLRVYGVPGAPCSGRALHGALDALLSAFGTWAEPSRFVRAQPAEGCERHGLCDGLMARLGRDRGARVPGLLVTTTLRAGC
jgi:hypothetical protein